MCEAAIGQERVRVCEATIGQERMRVCQTPIEQEAAICEGVAFRVCDVCDD